MTPPDAGTERVRPFTRRRTSLLPRSTRKRRERYVGWREPAWRITPWTTVSPPARVMQTYTGPVGTSRSRTSRACAWRRRRAAARRRAAEDERERVVRVVAVRSGVDVVLVSGTVLA